MSGSARRLKQSFGERDRKFFGLTVGLAGLQEQARLPFPVVMISGTYEEVALS
jgi:hypothetical protein